MLASKALNNVVTGLTIQLYSSFELASKISVRYSLGYAMWICYVMATGKCTFSVFAPVLCNDRFLWFVRSQQGYR